MGSIWLECNKTKLKFSFQCVYAPFNYHSNVFMPHSIIIPLCLCPIQLSFQCVYAPFNNHSIVFMYIFNIVASDELLYQPLLILYLYMLLTNWKHNYSFSHIILFSTILMSITDWRRQKLLSPTMCDYHTRFRLR